MDSFDTTLDMSELFEPDLLLFPDGVSGRSDDSSQSSDDEPCLLVNTDTKFNYGGYCVIT
ncbi:hypothetical protein BDR07DRAFT_1434392 [Suillus spraguei]|nr:hypothetical protein BDR07DRAFT_1434392 [Suillus spraguei]